MALNYLVFEKIASSFGFWQQTDERTDRHNQRLLIVHNGITWAVLAVYCWFRRNFGVFCSFTL